MNENPKSTLTSEQQLNNNNNDAAAKLRESAIRNDKADKLKAGLFLTIVTVLGLASGFGFSLGSTKKKESKTATTGPKTAAIKPGLKRGSAAELNYLYESGADLARRALLRATLYSVSGFSLLCFGIWKLSGARDFQEFRLKVGSVLPKIKKPSDKQGRTEFENLTELFQYVIDEDNKKKLADKQEQQQQAVQKAAPVTTAPVPKQK